MPAVFSIFSISKWLGVFPYDRDGISQHWLMFSSVVLLGYLFVVVVLFNFDSTILNPSNVFIFFVNTLHLVLVHLPMPLHVYRITSNENFFYHMSSVISQIPAYVDFGVPAAYAIWRSVYVFLSPRKFISIIMPLSFSRYALFMLNTQYIVFINSKARKINKLRSKIDNYPMAYCINLHTISSSVEEIHKIFAPQLLVTTIALTGSSVAHTFLIFNTHSLVGLLTVFENIFLVLSIIWQCSHFDSEVKAFYAELFRVVWEQNVCSNKKLVLYLLNQRKVKFSACGFFTLGCPLFTSVIAAATTYLVILIQFT